MTYSESKAEIIFFSTNRDELLQFKSQFRDRLDKKGTQYDGPIPLPQVTPGEVTKFLHHINSPEQDNNEDEDLPEEWLFKIATTEENINMLVSASQNNSPLFARQYHIVGSKSVTELLSFDLPEPVYAAVALGKKNHPSGGGHDPYTWNPDLDHIPSHPDGPW